MTDTTRPDMRRAVDLAREAMEVVDGCAESEWETEHHLARALLEAHDEVGRMRAVYEAAVWHDAARCDGPNLCATTDLEHDDECSIVRSEVALRTAIDQTTSAAAGRGGEGK